MKPDCIKEAIFDHIQNNRGTDRLDVTIHFRLPANITYAKIAELIKEGRVIMTDLYGWGKHKLEAAT